MPNMFWRPFDFQFSDNPIVHKIYIYTKTNVFLSFDCSLWVVLSLSVLSRGGSSPPFYQTGVMLRLEFRGKQKSTYIFLSHFVFLHLKKKMKNSLFMIFIAILSQFAINIYLNFRNPLITLNMSSGIYINMIIIPLKSRDIFYMHSLWSIYNTEHHLIALSLNLST